MSKVEFIKVKYRLAEQLQRPGGMTVQLATERAARELKAAEGDARADLHKVVTRLEVMCQMRKATLDEVYDVSSSVIDVAGLFDDKPLCEAAYSLCELCDRLRTQGREDWGSIVVHVDALRMILGKGHQAVGVESVIEGLWVLTDRYRDPPTG